MHLQNTALYLLFYFGGIFCIELSKGALGPKFFTFVHGGDDAKFNFTDADNFCKKHLEAPFHGLDSTTNLIDDRPGSNVSASFWKPNDSNDQFRSYKTRLASLHSYPETISLVKWISKKDIQSFWIGGIVTKTLNEHQRPIVVLKWTDGSNSEYSFLRLPNTELATLSVGESRCLSVDYSNGHWGVHPCGDKRYFVCLTVPVVGANDEHLKSSKFGNPSVPASKPFKHTIIKAEEFARLFN